jgi:hypothetical protein
MMLAPGETSSISFSTHMMEGMEGPHTFEIVVSSNDPVEPKSVLKVVADFGGKSGQSGGH